MVNLAWRGLFEPVRALVQRGKYDEGLEVLWTIHRQHHDRPLVHLWVHCLMLSIAIKSRRPIYTLGQLLPIIFAIPVSLIQRIGAWLR